MASLDNNNNNDSAQIENTFINNFNNLFNS